MQPIGKGTVPASEKLVGDLVFQNKQVVCVAKCELSALLLNTEIRQQDEHATAAGIEVTPASQGTSRFPVRIGRAGHENAVFFPLSAGMQPDRQCNYDVTSSF